jgi:hypothetical protein
VVSEGEEARWRRECAGALMVVRGMGKAREAAVHGAAMGVPDGWR